MSAPAATGYRLRMAGPDDLPGARSVMLDTFYEVFGIGYLPEHHHDVIDPETTYLRHPLNQLWVAEHEGRIVATTAIRAQGPRHPPHPAWLAEEFPDRSTAQLFRVYVRPEHHRRGLATRLVREAIDHVSATPAFDRLYLHTDARTPGALDFWLTFGRIIHDARGFHTGFQTVHLEIPLSRA
ncbi:GNAT family N-acetyltransferase [Nocardia amikacinitolerans]|uniref:GNAT family N-acetyltransferase n=1 Tax=Nocardia amikacinitolerans TaxID=756689 RepID=UPI0020A37ED0|nr:GNAT family N-acetyltransferase [Nocardia amikacinitolerans]MCP2288794.1 Acetyltransferase (GNAT) family protein [Nocardia amikacinitolerans]